MGSSSKELKVLFISHEHPAFGPGQIETYAHQLYEAVREAQDVEPILLARLGFPSAIEFPRHLGTPFGLFEGDDHEHWVFSEVSDFDQLNLTMRRKAFYTSYLKPFLVGNQPDVVHIQGLMYLGLDLLPLIKKTLPHARIVHTLHDYRPICHRDGVMVRTLHDEELCDHYSPRRCNECFPEVAPAEFFMRKRFVETQLEQVDLFLAPSQFLMDRYVDWGIPAEKIRVSELGRPRPERQDSPHRENRDRFGFFGELTQHSGAVLLLNAMKLLDKPETRLRLHGRNLEWQPFTFQDEFRQSLASSPNVTVIDRYDEADLPALMQEIDWVVVPSLWWEGGALAVEDAFRFGKPVICSRIGALAEAVEHELNGLYFRRDDQDSLAAALRRACESQGLWAKLREGIPQVKSIEEDAESLIETYMQLHESKPVSRE